ncbi:MAG: hypothetical protein KKD56_04545 [Acidobacteria bacterium]|nr:hypothetical protein [Acidobacteriota bacterium]MCG2814784.1 hypothetical protein [Candidatus Aminicenantes bacterium]MBU1338320.1 hypothetical protein [Acidobacteriota bacterium]MBU1475054.1 hypothetical protein [Acidobacteriota bacterium]MBU2437563.1 hypothetical protein [Acidobacteriota bacterium]
MNDWKTIHRAKGRSFLLKAEQSPSPSDYSKYERLRMAIWGEPADPFSGERNCLCENYFDLGGSVFLAAYSLDGDGAPDEKWDNFAGFSYGYVGVRDKTVGYRRVDNLCFYSQYTGIKPSFEGFGLGVAIKEFQKKLVLDLLGVSLISCTYDPLTSVNAARNIHRFGMDVLEYKEAHYENFTGRLNRMDVPCDRFYILWDLKKERLQTAGDLSLFDEPDAFIIRGEPVFIQGKSGKVELEGVKRMPVKGGANRVLLEIPSDFYRMLRETDVDDSETRRIPLEWRLTTRKAFRECFDAGFRVADFLMTERDGRRRNAYLLLRD